MEGESGKTGERANLPQMEDILLRQELSTDATILVKKADVLAVAAPFKGKGGQLRALRTRPSPHWAAIGLRGQRGAGNEAAPSPPCPPPP